MKPQLLLMLLLSIPPLISNLLACENAESSAPPATAEKSYTAPAKDTPAPAATPATPALVAAPAPAKAEPSRPTPASVKAWYMM